jgi:hypothetical protein
MNKPFALLLCAALAGCAGAPLWNPNTADQLTPGVSTLADAKKLFGEPDTTERGAEGVTSYMWCARGMCNTLAFDADGTLRAY